jgi:hypothetical protein
MRGVKKESAPRTRLVDIRFDGGDNEEEEEDAG